MERIEGKTLFDGIAIGRIAIYKKTELEVKCISVPDSESELRRYEMAKQQAVEEMKELYQKALKEVGEVNARIFDVHAMMLQDIDYNESVSNMICKQKVNAEYAVAQIGQYYSDLFEKMEDEYFKGRSVDVRDVSEKLIHILMNSSGKGFSSNEQQIILAKELTPSETIQMDKDMILAFVTELGSRYSHTAILARSMNIPALTEVKINPEWEGKMAAVNGFSGEFYIEPDEATLQKLCDLKKEADQEKALLEKYKGKETVTKSGQKIHLCANIGNTSDLESVLENDAEGIGLFRTEFLYLERDNYPTEEEQFQEYKKVVEALGGKKVIIRTLDIGADKKVDYFALEAEENPAMGYRAIRICLDREEMFKTQLRAILRAAAFGNIAIMFPMIISVAEVRKAKELLREAKDELIKEGIKCSEPEIGIMIETPAAVMISKELAKDVDFFSIGTNDLTQYTLAIDRQNGRLDAFYDAHHPAILSMIDMVVRNGHDAGIRVGICGELGSDLSMTETFLKMGIDELSVAPNMILQVRQVIREAEV